MSITLFSVLTTVICSGILAAALCILKRLRVFRGKSYINASILLYIAALLRLLLPFEFFFTRSCGFPAVCNPLREVMIYPVYGDSINIEGFFSFAWLLLSAVLLLRYLYHYKRVRDYVHGMEMPESEKDRAFLREIAAAYGAGLELCFRRSTQIAVPLCFGILHPNIILPKTDYSEEELRCIIAHECHHILRGDLLLKQLANLLCCLYWWNPLPFFLRNGLEESLELRCDLSVTEKMNRAEKTVYMRTLLRELKLSGERAERRKDLSERAVYCTALIGKRDRRSIRERFSMIAGASENTMKRRGFGYTFLAMLTALLLIAASYAIVFQSYYQSPEWDGGEKVLSSRDLILGRDENEMEYLQIKGEDTKYYISEETMRKLKADNALPKETERREQT